MVVAQGLEYNVSKLHKFLFGEDNYQPSETVQTISDYLINYTGIPTVKLDEDIEPETDGGEVDTDNMTQGDNSEE